MSLGGIASAARSLAHVAWRDAAPAGATAAAAGGLGSALAAPGWMIALGQAAIVVVFTTRSVRREMRELRDDVQDLRGIVGRLKCRPLAFGPALTPCPIATMARADE